MARTRKAAAPRGKGGRATGKGGGRGGARKTTTSSSSRS